MALNFSPPQDLINSYLNRPQPAELANQGIQQALQSYIQMHQQQLTEKQGALGNYLKLLELDPQLAQTPLGKQLAQKSGGGLDGYTPPSASTPTPTVPVGGDAPVTPSSGSPIIDHFNSLMGRGKLGKQVVSDAKISMETAKLSQEIGPQQMYDQAGNLITTLPPNAKVVPVQKPTITPEEREAGKRQAKINAEKPKAKGSLNDALRQYDSLIAEATAIKNDPALSSATGVLTPLTHIPGSGAKRIVSRVETLKSKTLLNTLGSLKSLSANGASGFGQLSEKEGEALRNAVTTLNMGQSTKDFSDSIDRLIQDAQFHKQNLQNTYKDTYGEDFQPMTLDSGSSGPHGATVTQGGHTYHWNTQTKKYE